MKRHAARAALVAAVLAFTTIGVQSAGVARPTQLRLGDMPIQVTRTIEGYRAPSAELARTDRRLLGLTGTARKPVLVKFDYDGLGSYAGGLDGLAATSPDVTGRPVKLNRPADAAYGRYVAAREATIITSIHAQVPGVKVGETFRIAFGGAAMRVPANRIDDLLRVPGVVAVMKDKKAQPQTDTTPGFLGADQVWPTLGGQSNAGENVLVGVLDTGVWPEHPSFADPGIDPIGGSFACEFGDGSDPLLGDPFTCNDKLVGAYAFTDTYMTFETALPGEFCNNATGECSARDADGHGTHTSSTAVGSPVDDASIFGIDRGDISGMAPGAHLIMYRVCLEEGCYQSDSIDAVEQAILDGVDVINFSISGGANPYTDGVELAFLDAYAAGILVNASAGNAGPGAGTADHGGPWTNTVGASTSPRQWLTTVHLTADNADTFDATGASITPGVTSDTPVVSAGDVAGYGDPECGTPLPAGSVTGQVVLCLGQFSRNLRANNVLAGGGAGMLLVVPPPGPGNLFTDNFWVPTVTINSPDPGIDLLDFVDAHSGIVAHWDTGSATAVTPDVMTSFSSRGPVGDWIKPDVTAPGIQILAGHTPEPVSVFGGPPGEFYQVIAGTSMSSPHAAGVSALVRAVHPSWTPGQVKSALMTSSIQQVLEEDGVTPADPFDMGAGSIRANLAVNPTLTFDETAANYAAGAADPLGRIDLNVPSINAPVMPGMITTTRTAVNVSGSKQKFTANVEAPSGASITVQPHSFSVNKGGSFTFSVTIDGTGLAEGQYFGRIDLVPQSGANKVTLPVAFLKTQGDVTLSHDCASTTIARRTSTPCQTTVTNFASVPANYELSVESQPKRVVRLQNVGAPGVATSNGFTAAGTLSPAEPPDIQSITPGGLFGYLPLEDFGVPPLATFTDETLVNLSVEPFRYGGEVYDRIGITSNGYAVVGGGGSADLDFVPQTFPDPTSPNNVLAPFWTDLNPADAPATGAIRADYLCASSVDCWLVIDWDEIPTFGTGGADLHSFEIWLQLTLAPGELITYEMGDIGVGDPGVGTSTGAENRNGSSGVNLGSIPGDGTDYTITAGTPTAGGSVTVAYDAFGSAAGTGSILARLETDVTPGVTTEAVVITVT